MSARRVSRREFLAGLGAAGALAAGGYGVHIWTREGSHPAARSPQGAASDHRGGNQPRTLVLLELAGGNDALNMVVPHADPQYRVLRPTLAVADPIDLDGHIGLSPKLTTLADQYRAGRLAIVEGVGVPDPDLSHFASLQRWWTADPDLHAKTGWLGRYLDRAVGYDDPLAGVAIGPGPSPVLAGASSFATSITDAQGLQPARLDTDVRDTLLQWWASLVPSQPPPSLLGQVQRAIHETLDARTRLTDDLGAQTSSASPNASPGDEGTLAGALELAAQLAASKDHPRVIHVHVEGDFDTHEGEAQRHPALMADLDAGVKAFLSALDEHQASDHVVLATMSEFGRRAAENGLGTDHGAAAAHLVLGAPVKGGRHGEPPSLTKLDSSGNLVSTVDYRGYDAALLEWLDPSADLDAVLGTGPGSLNLFS